MSPMQSKLGLRRRKKQRNRERLIEAARSLFMEHGFEGTTIDAIADAAGVSRRTFFRYFPSKESVAFPEDERRRAEFLELALASQASHPVERLQVGFSALAQEFSGQLEDERRKQQVIESHPALTAYQWQCIQKWQCAIEAVLLDSAEPLPEAEKRQRQVLATALTAVLARVLKQWLQDGQKSLLAEVIETLKCLKNAVLDLTVDLPLDTKLDGQEP